MRYTLLFEVANRGYNWSFTGFGLLFVGLGLWLVKNRRRLPTLFRGISPRAATALAYFCLVFSMLWTTLNFATDVLEQTTLRDALLRGEVQVVEGRVQNLSSTEQRGRDETLTVCGVPFSYADGVITEAFHRTRAKGGPMREGLWLRISYLDNRILRLEAAQEDPGAAAVCRPPSSLGGR